VWEFDRMVSSIRGKESIIQLASYDLSCAHILTKRNDVTSEQVPVLLPEPSLLW